MNVGIVGCGFIGQKRAANLGGHRLAGVFDLDQGRAAALAARVEGCRACSSLEELLGLPGLQAVVVATLHRELGPLALKAVEAGKHVLVEKPGGRRPGELRPAADLAARRGLVVKVGFNHRFHPALLKAREIFDTGALGPMMYVRGRYGHGGRIGYDREWRADPELSGGGELIDQGMHLIDLARVFLGEFSEVSGYLPTLYWDMPVEDNAFLLLRTPQGQAAWLHATWSEWKNLFCLEICGRQAKLQVDGLGGSYGTERLTYYKMKPEMGPPEVEAWEFPGPDRSWELEFEDFALAVAGGRRPYGDVEDGLRALEVLEKLYRQSNRP